MGSTDAIRFTQVSASEPARLSKGFSLDEAGALQKHAGGQLVSGQARALALPTLEQFATVLQHLKPSQALVFGVPAHDLSTIVQQSRLADEQAHAAADSLPLIARTKDHFAWPAGPGVLMLDYDPADGREPLRGPDLVQLLCSVWPELAVAPMVWRPSASSCVWHGDEELRGIRGQRLYVLVHDARDIPRTGRVLFDRLWLAGHGYYITSKSGALLERGPVDAAVWSPERLDFCGGAECTPPLSQRLPAPVLYNPAAGYLDTRTLADLTPDELQRLASLKQSMREAPDLLANAQAVQAQWVESRLAEALTARPDADPELLRDQLLRAVRDKRLMGDFRLQLADGRRLTVGELLDRPDQFHGQRCADPLEPDYGRDARIAWVCTQTAGRPFIFSHAHGGQRFTLHRATRAIQCAAGELPLVVSKTLEQIRLDGALFERGGALVRIDHSGNAHAVDADWLRVYLTGLVSFQTWNPKAKEWQARDADMVTVRSVLAMRGEWNLPALRGVHDAPLMAPTGRVLAMPGYDRETQLLLMLAEAVHVPSAPGREQAREALRTLWFAFEEFPFCGAVDRAVMLAALLTAVQRPALATAPGFLFSAPAAGSGKTLLALCCAVLAGSDPPAVMPPCDDEEEMRKRIFAALLEGRRAVLLDNLTGSLDSATLCAVLTSPTYSDRVLGVTQTATAPTCTLLLASGNNVQPVGDLNRRILVARIDSKTERPYARAFDLDPLQHCRVNRQAMVLAALTLLRAWWTATNGQRQTPDRMASFEDWSDTVRQCVLWCAGLGVLELADPAEAIESGYAADPETAKLQALLIAWHRCFGERHTSVSVAVQRSTPDRNRYAAPGGDSPEEQLRQILLEIAGERDSINTRRLGRWIEKQQGRPVKGLKFEGGPLRDGVKTWRATQSVGFSGFSGFSLPHTRGNDGIHPCAAHVVEGNKPTSPTETHFGTGSVN